MLKNKIKTRLKQIIALACLLIFPVSQLNSSPLPSNSSLIAQSDSNEDDNSSNTTDEDKKNTKDKKDKTEKRKTPPVSKSSEMIEKFTHSITNYNVFEHIMINMTYGIITGGSIGAMGGLVLYDSTDTVTSKSNIQMFALVGIGVGGLSAITIGIIERIKGKPFSIGPGFFNYGWYGALGGILLGTISGSMVYITSNDVNDIWHGLGYGAMGGFVAGTILRIIFPKSNKYQIDFLPGPKKTLIRLHMKF
ncbi:MAG: hypothetical protein ABUK01_07940 [Leptospirales bacterium]